MARKQPVAIQAEALPHREAVERAPARVQPRAPVPARQGPGLHPVGAEAGRAHLEREAVAQDQEQRLAQAWAPGLVPELRAPEPEMARVLERVPVQAPGPVKDRARATVREPVPPMWRALPGRRTVIFPLSCWARRPRKPIPKPWAHSGED